MLGSTSLVALVGGGGDRPAFSPRKVVVYNTKTRASICEVAFKTVVLGVRLNRRRLVVILEARVHIFDMQDMSALHVVDTGHNPRGLCVLSAYEGGGGGGGSGLEGSGSGSGDHTGMCPLVAPCSSGVAGEIVVFDAFNLNLVNVAKVHKNALATMCMSARGDLLATASEQGTIVRVMALPSANKIAAFRRGSYSAKIYALSFNATGTLLCAASASGTIHIFHVQQGGNGGGLTRVLAAGGGR